MSGALTDALSPEDAAEVVANTGLVVLGASAAAVVTLGVFPPHRRPATSPGNDLHLLWSTGLAPHTVEAWRHITTHAPNPVARVTSIGSPLFFDSLTALVDEYPAFAAAAAADERRAYAVVPVWGNGHLRGAFVIAWPEERAFDDDDRAFVQALGTMCAQAILRAHLAEAERRGAARFASLVEATAQLVWSATPDGQSTGVQRDWEAFTGQAAHESDGSGWLDAIHPEDRADHLARWQRAIAERTPFESVIRIRHRSGEWHYLQLHAVPVFSREDALLEWIGVSTDITDRKRVEADLEAAHAEALAASRVKAEFLATMSHELRTPLTAVMGFTELLTDEIIGPITPLQREHLARVKGASEHLLVLVEDILSFARIESAQEKIAVGLLDLRQVLHDVIDLVTGIAEKRGISIQNGPIPSVLLESDEQKVRQILINLLANAIKFTERGAVTLNVDASDTQLLVWVTDTGPGIRPEHWEQIYDPFWQVDQSRTRRAEGAGLGLSVARSYARLLGGDVRIVASELGVGSIFELTLPLRVPARSTANEPSAREQRTRTPTPPSIASMENT